MKKINFQDNITKANEETMNQFQNNIENAINETNNNVNLLKENAINNIYSLEEINTNKRWIDGKIIYKKVIKINSLPNNYYATIDHNIQNVNFFVNVSGIGVSGGGYYFNIPFVGTPSIFSSTQVAIRANTTQVQISATTDLSAYSAYIFLEYTKNE